MSLSFQVLCVIRLYHQREKPWTRYWRFQSTCGVHLSFAQHPKTVLGILMLRWNCFLPLEQWCIFLTECNKPWLHFIWEEILVLYFHGQILRLQNRPLSKPSALNDTSCAEEQMKHFYSRCGDVCLMKTYTSGLASYQGKFRKTHHPARKYTRINDQQLLAVVVQGESLNYQQMSVSSLCLRKIKQFHSFTGDFFCELSGKLLYECFLYVRWPWSSAKRTEHVHSH